MLTATTKLRKYCRLMMYHEITWFVIIFMMKLAVSDSKHNTVTVLGQKYSIYRVNKHIPFTKFQNVRSNIPADVEDLVTKLPHEIMDLHLNNGWRRDIVPSSNNGIRNRNMCNLNNGNCAQICADVDGMATCSCKEGFSLRDNGDCIKASRDEILLSGTSGNFTIDISDFGWIIQAPQHHIIRCELTLEIPEYSYSSPSNIFNYVTVYDGLGRNEISGNVISDTTREWISTGPYLYISVKYFKEKDVFFHGSYETGASYLVSTTEGAVISFDLTAAETCISVTYSSPEDRSLAVEAGSSWSRSYFRPTFTHSGPRWKTEIYKTFVDWNYLIFTFHGMNSQVYSLRKCTDIENLWIAGRGAYENEPVGDPVADGPQAMCLNGGSWLAETETCLCPIGFTGPLCAEGCGPNRYGENCTEVCSLLSTNCEGVIFCTERMCSCAPGFKGINCDTPCQENMYGANCRQRCGKCKYDNPCDSYTGKCISGCATGFYPPMCQKTYKVLLDKPSIAEIGYTHVIVNLSFRNVTGVGDPKFYQLQYKLVEDESWSELAPRVISNETKFNITGLLPGKDYHIRIILIDKDRGSYQGHVPHATITTKCSEPEKVDYHFYAKNVTATEILLQWSYPSKKYGLECGIKKFELTFLAGDDEFTAPLVTLEGTEKLYGLLPDTDYSFQLIGETVTGRRIVASKIAVHTLPAAPGKVRHVQVTPSDIGTMLMISWQPPWNYAGAELRYRVIYECKELLACENMACHSSVGHMEVPKNSIVLSRLKPHAVYEIRIAAMSSNDEVAEEYIINATTPYSAPMVKASAAENPILSVTNTSATVSWLPPTDCSDLNGFLNGYSYTLMDAETNYTVFQGSSPENILYASFYYLVPRHCYEVHVSVVASGGTDFRNILAIPFCTTSTAPDHVQSLEVYKRGRKMVGLRWASPLNTYGDIESFIITYSKEGKGANRTVVIQPKQCAAWSNLYCHTLYNLSPGKLYRFVVQARNKEVKIYGESASVEAVTTEGVSTSPKNLRIINATENSALLGWEIPDNINGQLRSFIILTEQIDMKGVSDECCDDIPLEEYHVTSEEPFYTYEITRLSAASTYSVAVAAKTVSLGEAARITLHTNPPKPNMPQNALTVAAEECSSECDTVTLHLHPAESVTGVNRTYILLLLSNSSRTQEAFDNNDLTALLHSKFGDNYHILSQQTEDEIKDDPVITFEKEELGLENAELHSPQFALVLVQEYMGKYSMDVFVANNY